MKYEGINARGRVLIIGYGNPLRTDDGLGWRAAYRLAASLKDAPVEALAVHQLTPELGEAICGGSWMPAGLGACRFLPAAASTSTNCAAWRRTPGHPSAALA
jgi:hypothetical protein